MSECVWVCVCSATDPKAINSANTFVLTQSQGEVFVGVYLTSHYLLCIGCLSHEEQHDNTWNELFPPLSRLVIENSDCSESGLLREIFMPTNDFNTYKEYLCPHPLLF